MISAAFLRLDNARASLPARSEGMSVQAATRTMCEHLEAGPSQDAEG